jgi:hypothetical protein
MMAISGVFLAAWLGYFALLLLLPIRYTSVDLATAVTMLAVYVTIAIGCTFAVAGAWRPGSVVKPAPVISVPRPLDQRELCQLVIIALGASFIGLALLAYVRVVVQGIDYTQGLAVARELWRTEGEERAGISSPLSVPGYGLGFFFFAAAFLGQLHWEHLTRWTRRLLVVGTVLLLAGHSVLTGGRSVLLIQLVALAAVGALRRVQGKRALPGRAARGVLYGGIAVLGAMIYFLYIFSERASASGIAAETYVAAAIGFMGAAPTESFFAIASLPEPFASTAHFVVVAGAYVTHSAGTVASVMEYSTHGGVATFLGARTLLARLGGVGAADLEWALSGAFLSLPGAFWYDYGLKGVVAAAAATGIALAVVWRVVSRGYGGGLSVGFAAAVLITAIMSPLILAPDSLSFPFMMLGYVALSCYSYVRFGPRNWWNVGRSGRYRRIET